MPRVPHGRLMAPIAERLAPLVAAQPSWRLYCDHTPGATPAHSYFGAEHHAWSELSTVDLLVADGSTGEALLIVEVEETGADPKRVLGDVYALALAERLAAGKGRDKVAYRLTPATCLLVCFPAKGKGGWPHKAAALQEGIRATFRAVPSPLALELVMVERREELVEAVAARVAERLLARC